MQFFLREILARAVAAYLCLDCWRTLRKGLAEGRIVTFSHSLLFWSTWAIDRDKNPVQFRIAIIGRTFAMIACLAIAVFGWFANT